MEDNDTPSGPDANTLISHSSNLHPARYEGSTTNITTPSSSNVVLADSSSIPFPCLIPKDLTQELVDANPKLKRLQLDLLILTSFNENETLHWRPSWFKQEPFSQRFWTLQNPPNVVTERLPRLKRGRDSFTRIIGMEEGSSSAYIKSWDHWKRYCDLYGVPYDFLCENQIRLLRLGLSRDSDGFLCPPPSYPLYPEPQPLGQGRYLLDPSTYISHLPRKFHNIDHAAAVTDPAEVAVIHSDGAIAVEPRDEFFMHESQWTHFDGYGGYRLDEPQIVDESAPKEQGPGRHWSYLPWTREQEKSCVPMRIDLRPLVKRIEERKTEVPMSQKALVYMEISKL